MRRFPPHGTQGKQSVVRGVSVQFTRGLSAKPSEKHTTNGGFKTIAARSTERICMYAHMPRAVKPTGSTTSLSLSGVRASPPRNLRRQAARANRRRPVHGPDGADWPNGGRLTILFPDLENSLRFDRTAYAGKRYAPKPES